LIDNFWLQIQGLWVKTAIQPSEVVKAYETLLLPQDTEFPKVKRQYHKLLHIAHPDKGGDTAQTQEIEHSYRILKSVNS
jgi:curved DNA-binding protein CbpA